MEYKEITLDQISTTMWIDSGEVYLKHIHLFGSGPCDGYEFNQRIALHRFPCKDSRYAINDFVLFVNESRQRALDIFNRKHLADK